MGQLFGRHSRELLASIGELHDNPERYSDVTITVGTTNFQCHKLILALQSTYFQQKLYPPAQQVRQITIDNIQPEDFKNVLRFIYTGEIELERKTVGGILRVAKLLCIDALNETVPEIMRDDLDVESCLDYWKLANEFNDFELKSRCEALFSKEVLHETITAGLQDVTENMLEAAIRRDDLNVTSEVDVCETILKWCDVNVRNGKSVRSVKLLSCVRWSAVSIEYIKSMLVNNEVVMKDQLCFEFLSRVIFYRLSGIQFQGLHTFHRPSTGLEVCAVIFGINTGDSSTAESCSISLQRRNKVKILTSLPTQPKRESVACVTGSAVYVTGIGAACNETWRWDAVGGWARCADMIHGRRRHCATFINSTSMYALGGFVDSTNTTLSSIEQFDTTTNKWTAVGRLVNCTDSAACVAYKMSVYVFGGYEVNNKIDCIQVFNTATKKCTVLAQRLPRPERLLRAVLWDKSVLMMNNRTCLIFDMETQTIEQRDQFAAGVSHFGLVVDNETLFVIGGGNYRTGSDGKLTWTCTDEVKCVPVMDIVNNQQTVNWIQHAKLNTPSLVQAFAPITIGCLTA